MQDITGLQPSDSSLRLLNRAVTVLVLGHWVACLTFLFEESYNYPEGSFSDTYQLADMGPGRQYMICLWKALGMLIMVSWTLTPSPPPHRR